MGQETGDLGFAQFAGMPGAAMMNETNDPPTIDHLGSRAKSPQPGLTVDGLQQYRLRRQGARLPRPPPCHGRYRAARANCCGPAQENAVEAGRHHMAHPSASTGTFGPRRARTSRPPPGLGPEATPVDQLSRNCWLRPARTARHGSVGETLGRVSQGPPVDGPTREIGAMPRGRVPGPFIRSGVSQEARRRRSGSPSSFAGRSAGHPPRHPRRYPRANPQAQGASHRSGCSVPWPPREQHPHTPARRRGGRRSLRFSMRAGAMLERNSPHPGPPSTLAAGQPGPHWGTLTKIGRLTYLQS